MDEILISVLMGVRYHSSDTSLLARSVGSILAQSAAALELLVCDDGSSEPARRLLERIARQDCRLRLIRQGGLLELPAKLNACLRASAGSWIARMDDDDFASPLRFARQIAFLEAAPGIAFAGSNALLIRDGQPAGVRVFPEWPEVKDFFFSQPFLHPALMFRREALLAVGGYSEASHCLLCEDYDLLLRMYAMGFRGANIQENLLTYTLPHTVKGSRRMRHRWNEAVTRYYRFRELGVLPGALPYVVKPLAVGLIPEPLLRMLKGIFP